MSQGTVTGGTITGGAVLLGARTAGREAAPDPRRRLQLVLATVWLLDAILQFQSAMFTRAFTQMLAGSAAGNPALLARPIGWSASLVGQHVVVANAVFAAIQLALGLGIAWRPATRIALGASVAWALGVWWLGEGFGGIFTGTVGPIDGAPGPAVLYALLAILLWPASHDRPSPFAAGRAVGAWAARAVWLILWAGLAYFALQPAVRAPRAVSATISGLAGGQPHWLAARAPRALGATISGLAGGQPHWLAALDSHAAAFLAGRGLLTAVLLAAAFVVVAVGPYLPPRWSRGILAVAVGLSAIIWLAQGLGGILTGMGTDPDSAPLLALLALAYWPRPAGPAGVAAPVPAGPGATS